MSTIIFAIDSALSHYNASLSLAKQLRNAGHRIIYLAIEEKDAVNDIELNRKLVERLGFDFRTIAINSDDINAVMPVVAELAPDLVVLDYLHCTYGVLFHQFGLRFVIFQTMVCLSKNRSIPPVSSKFVPSQSIWSKLVVEMLWLGVFLKYFRRIQRLKKFSAKNGLTWEEIDYMSDISFGIKKFPELIVPPHEFDFPWRKARANQYFVGPMVDLDREETATPEFDEFFNAYHKGPDQFLVYCSLGTMGVHHYQHSMSFFKKVIQACEQLRGVTLVLSVGNKINSMDLGHTPKSVYAFQRVPQLKMLRKTDVMITHGGANSITECILLGVPMLVYPLNRLWDQNGNAARVMYHRLGLRGDVRTDSISEISRKLREVIYNEKFRKNGEKWKALYLKNNNSNHAAEVIGALLSERNNTNVVDKSY